ncbi:unnamed protein product [Gongylonema pulchrum]|uniref:Nsp1_C domain-containing protein n=1 Tax=Gongylonema pulchrum TaxID=637853 RepID=A0A183DS01_9BILA|nr:unnamed protein product [Gongylonema pulchrum]
MRCPVSSAGSDSPENSFKVPADSNASGGSASRGGVDPSSFEFGIGKTASESGLMGFGAGNPPPSSRFCCIWEQRRRAAVIAVLNNTENTTTEAANETEPPISASQSSANTPARSPLPQPVEEPEAAIPKNSGLIPASPPLDFVGEFGTGVGAPPFRGSFGAAAPLPSSSDNNQIEESLLTGESALTPNRAGPTGDGLGPPILPGAAIPPPVPALGIGGAAAGILPAPSPYDLFQTTQNPPTTLKPSALLSVLNKADIGFNQAISHFEQGTPVESAAIDILEVALGSEKLDSQAKLLGHIDRTIGIDNLQRLQRWANTGGALDALKEQLAKIAQNYSPPENLLPTLPPQLQYLFAPSGKR